jgi:hypothetical protein
MPNQRQSVREARRNISKALAAGDTITIGDNWKTLRGFIVGVKPHNGYDRKERKKALKEARASFIKAWMKEAEQ